MGKFIKKGKDCRFYRTSVEGWGDWVTTVKGIAVFETDSQFEHFTLMKARGGFGLVFKGCPPIKAIKAARLLLLGKGEQTFIYNDIFNRHEYHGYTRGVSDK